MATPTFTKSGNKATAPAKLPKAIFDLEVKNHDLLKQAYVAYLSNGRTNNAKTLKRGEVRGGGKKPWKQKGTGRARFGSIRVPIWRGGGITFGPTGDQNFTHVLPTKTKRQAVRQALSLANQSGKVNVLEAFNPDGKVSATAAVLKKIGASGKTLLVVDNKDEMIVRATRNVQDLIVVQARYLNVYDVLNASMIVITSKALDVVSDWLSAPAKATADKKEANPAKVSTKLQENK
jgi:large subunit ribosomal protein L4